MKFVSFDLRFVKPKYIPYAQYLINNDNLDRRSNNISRNSAGAPLFCSRKVRQQESREVSNIEDAKRMALREVRNKRSG